MTSEPITLNYINLANGTSGRRAHRKGVSTPGFLGPKDILDGGFISLGTMSIWASGRQEYLSVAMTAHRNPLRQAESPRHIAMYLDIVRSGVELPEHIRAICKPRGFVCPRY